MIIKSYSAPTIAAALKKIKEELGGDAIVLKTRACPEEEAALTGQRVEVTACIDEKAVDYRKFRKNKTSRVANKTLTGAACPPAVEKPGAGEYNPDKVEKTLNQILSAHRSPDLFDDIDSTVKPVFLNLLDSDVPVEIAHRLSRTVSENLSDPGGVDKTAMAILMEELNRMASASVSLKPGMKVAFVGPAGAGKTSIVGKVAAQLCTKFGQKIKLYSLDNIKISAYEEIGAYADLLDLPLSPLDETIDREDSDSIILIDTPAFCRDKDRCRKINERIKAVNPDVIFLVFSVCSRSNDLIDGINTFENIKPDYLIASHLDESDRWGGIMTMTDYLDRPLAFVTDAPAGMGKLTVPDTAKIARHLLKLEVSSYD